MKKGPTIIQIRGEKERVDLNAGIKGLKNVITGENYYEGVWLIGGGLKIKHLGDYGNINNYVVDYFQIYFLSVAIIRMRRVNRKVDCG